MAPRRSLVFILALLGSSSACSDDTNQGGTGGHEDDGGGGSNGEGAAGASSEEGGSGGGGEGVACPSGTLVDTSALVFDGADDAVTMGVAPSLGLATFTLEAWVRRDGAGLTAGTGVGGLALVPIISKGRGEDDGSNVDCNYAFGLYGDVIAADFEDQATGLNHPVVGSTGIGWGSWHHVAATYDGATWRLYVDGKLDGESQANATPRADSIQHFGLGAAYNSTGVRAGALAGALDEVRVWDYARTEAEIAGARFSTAPSGAGLVGHWALDTGDSVPDSAGANPGTLSGAVFEAPGAVLDLGEPPVATSTSPEADAVLPADAVELSVSLDDPESHPLSVAFHVREISEGDDFTIVVLPDTQYYTRPNDNHDYFYDQTAWIMENQAAYNIVSVIHNGDIVDNGSVISQWTVADQAMSTLEVPQDGLPEGMPYGVCVGNHDESPNGSANSTTNFNVYFGIDRFSDRSYYGGHYGDDNDENWFAFSAGGVEFVVVNYQYNTEPDAAVLAWGRQIFEAHPDAFGIVNSHYIVGGSGSFGVQGQAIYESVKDVPNVHLMTNGHVANEARRTDEFEGHVIHSMLADYQGRPNGGGGLLRIWEFSPRNDELTVRTYSPTDDLWETDEDSEFTLAVKLDGIGSPFAEAARVDPASTEAATTLTGLQPGRSYEWYATITDCAHVTTTPVQSFSTEP